MGAYALPSMFLPFPLLLKSHIKKRKKVVLLGLFGLGLFITVIQIIRIQTVKKLANYIDSAPLILWSAVENNLGIIVANVPPLAPLVKYYSERSTRGGASGARSRRSGYTLGGGGGGDGGVGSRYATETWRSVKTARSGVTTSHLSKMMELGSVADPTELGSFEGHVVKGDNNSTESILESGAPRLPLPAGITKKVEVVVTRED